jgi:hypothetical protein
MAEATRAEETIERGPNGYYVGNWYGRDIRYPSVTTAIGYLNDFSKVKPDDLKKAADFGTAVHDTIDKYQRGTLDRGKLDMPLRRILGAWMKCKTEHGIVVEESETVIASHKYQYAGRLDIVARINGAKCLVELKSRKYNPVTDQLQVIAYKNAYNEFHKAADEKIRKVYFCGFDHVTGKYTFFEIKQKAGQPDHFQMFLCALALKKWEAIAK